MKNSLRKLFWPVLYIFEQGTEVYVYNPSHRKILAAAGILFVLLSAGSGYFAPMMGDKGFYLPVIVFFAVGIVCLIVSWLGSERAIAKIWGTGKKS